MSLIGSERKRGFLGKLGRTTSEVVATIRYGTPMAVSRAWRESMAAEAAARRAHRQTRGYSAARSKIVHAALIAGRGH